MKLATLRLGDSISIKAQANTSVRGELLKFFKANPSPDDNAVHALADKLKMSPHDVESQIYALLTWYMSGDFLKHGDDPDSNFDANELAMGVKVEMEHTNDPAIAKKIAKAHLSEIPDYYTWLMSMEKQAKEVKSQALMRTPGKLDAVRNISLLSPSGSLPLGDSHVNWADGLVFHEDDDLKGKVKNVVHKGNTIVQIGQKFYPVKHMQEMTNSRQWSFVLDYDERKEIARKDVQQVLRGVH